MTGQPPLLELRDVAVRAGGRRILAIATLGIGRGETLAVLGINGAGKSTLLRVAGGLRPMDTGALLLDGVPAGPAQARAVTAAVLQRPLLRSAATVRANVETGLRFAGVQRDERRRRAQAWLERLGLAELADRRAVTLSGGEAQRVSLARAFVLRPRLLLLDEPFNGLDAPSRAELLADLRDVLAAHDTAALFVTHDRHEAAAVADRVAILHDGTLRQLGAPASVLEHPADADCARLLGFENILPPEVLDTPTAVAVRAVDLRLVPGAGTGVVERILPFGGRTRVVANVGGLRVISDVADADGVTRGVTVGVAVDPGAARVIAPG